MKTISPLPSFSALIPGAAFLAMFAFSPGALARTWTNSDGVEIDADIVSATKSEVVLKMKRDGKDYTVPLAKLSNDDNAFVKEWLKEQDSSPASGKATSSPAVENWDAPWPALISGEVTLEIDTVEENEEEDRYVYHSPHYEYVTYFSKVDNRGRNLGEDIRLPDLKEFMLQDYGSFLENGNRNYGVSLLMAFYFFHWDGDESAANVKAFLKALKSGKEGEAALEALLAGRTYDELEVEMSKAWRARGVKLNFE